VNVSFWARRFFKSKTKTGKMRWHGYRGVWNKKRESAF
jgi:hypothetical protein